MTDDLRAETPTLLVVDDDESVRRSLRRLLTAAGYAVETFGNAADLLARDPLSMPGCLILDVHLPGLSGLDLHSLLLSTGMDKATVFVTGHDDIPASVRAMRSGAIDFLTKPIDEADLLGAVERALDRDRRARTRDVAMEELHRLADRLTPREREVCALVASGRPNKQIAALLGTSEKTIKVHRARVMTKLEVDSVPGLVRIADQLGMRYRANEQSNEAEPGQATARVPS